jgi:hypothetical protein
MNQMGFSELEFAAKKKRTRRERFLDQIEAATPWALLVEQIEPFYPKGERGRPPIGIERMLRMYIVQQCFGLADEATEDAVYDSQSIRTFVGIDLSRERAPDATTLLHFRRLLEKHDLTRAISRRSRGTWRSRVCCCARAPSWMPRSSRHRRRPRTGPRRGIRRCTRPRRATSGVCHEHRRQTCGAVLEMGVGLPKSACRSRLQTTRCCCVQKARW